MAPVPAGERRGDIRCCKHCAACMSSSKAAAHFLPQNKTLNLKIGHDFRDIDLLVAQNLSRLTRSFRAHNVDHSAISHSTEQVLDNITADIMGTEAAITTVQLLSGKNTFAARFWSFVPPVTASTMSKPGGVWLQAPMRSQWGYLHV